MTRIPDFFLVGAPKCGTTALNDYLAQHPDVFVPARKEAHFFGSDLEFTKPRMTRETYLRLFERCSGETRAGEASVWYLYSQRAAGEIRAFRPDARILIMLRHPVDVMVSLHNQRLYNGTEDLEAFADALAAEPERRRGRRLPPHFTNTMGFFYRDVVRFTGQVKRYFDVFGRERCHVVLFDDLQRDVSAVYADVCRFLEVSSGFRPRFEVVNANKDVRNRRLRDFLQFASPEARSRIRAILPSRVARKALKRRLLSWNTHYVRRAPLDPALRERLEAELRPEIQELGGLLGVDLLARWCPTRFERPPASAGRSRPDARTA